jgi:16S rRNA (cytosine967-C5)-methyltransferase
MKDVEVTARSVAADVLVRVDRDRAFAAAALDAEIARSPQLGGRDRALCTELTYGSLRVRRWLEERIMRHATRPLKKLDPWVRAHLVLSVFQLFFLRVPGFAAVNEAVGAIRRTKGPQVAAFANAVLRKLAAEAENERKAGTLDRAAVAVSSAPPWLFDALTEALGAEGARAYLGAALEPPAIGLRLRHAAERDAWIARLREAAPDASFEAGKVSPLAIRVFGAGAPQKLPGYAEGAWTAQEEGSQLVALALGAAAGETVLDACAGRGNKTAILAAAVGDAGAVDAADLHASKLSRLESELSRMGLSVRATHAVDWARGAGDAVGPYDRVLVDAPCSGSGTLGRRPDLYLRREAEDVSTLARLQADIAARASSLLRPGGRLVYAVCSVLRPEAEDVVAALLAREPSLAAAPFDGGPARALAGEETQLRLLPYVHGTDGYFLASFVKAG